jgi:hypothetical protein
MPYPKKMSPFIVELNPDERDRMASLVSNAILPELKRLTLEGKHAEMLKLTDGTLGQLAKSFADGMLHLESAHPYLIWLVEVEVLHQQERLMSELVKVRLELKALGIRNRERREATLASDLLPKYALLERAVDKLQCLEVERRPKGDLTQLEAKDHVFGELFGDTRKGGQGLIKEYLGWRFGRSPAQIGEMQTRHGRRAKRHAESPESASELLFDVGAVADLKVEDRERAFKGYGGLGLVCETTFGTPGIEVSDLSEEHVVDIF